MPEVEPRIYFQQVKPMVAGVTLEIDLRDAREAQLLEHRSPQPAHLFIVADFDVGRETIEPRRRAQLSPRELCHYFAIRPDVGVIADDLFLTALDGGLHHEIGFASRDMFDK